jgi:two-component system phosphate regulon sensor histidine kinase PhoR
MDPRSKTRLLLALSLILVASAVGLYCVLDGSLSNRRWIEAEAVLRSEVLLLEAEARTDLESADTADVQERLKGLGTAAGIRITLIAPDGTVIADTASNAALMDNHGTRPEVLAAMTNEFGCCRRESATLHIELLYVAKAIRREGQFIGWIRASLPTASVSPNFGGLEWGMSASIAAAGLASLALGRLWLRRMWR